MPAQMLCLCTPLVEIHISPNLVEGDLSEFSRTTGEAVDAHSDSVIHLSLVVVANLVANIDLYLSPWSVVQCFNYFMIFLGRKQAQQQELIEFPLYIYFKQFSY